MRVPARGSFDPTALAEGAHDLAWQEILLYRRRPVPPRVTRSTAAARHSRLLFAPVTPRPASFSLSSSSVSALAVVLSRLQQWQRVARPPAADQMLSTSQRDGEEEEGDKVHLLHSIASSRSWRSPFPPRNENAPWPPALRDRSPPPRSDCSVPLPPCISLPLGASRILRPASAMNGWDSRAMLDRYIYDYMIKKNMHETPEIFRREAALASENALPGGIDVPEGFLYEWWLIFYEAFVASQLDNGSFSGSSPTTMMTFPQETTASLTRQSVMNEEMTRDLANDTNTRLIFGDDFMWSKEWPSTKADHLPQNLMPLPYQQNPSTFSSTSNPVVVTDDLITQVGAHLVPPGLENHILSSRKVEDHKKIIVLSGLAESSNKRKASSEGNSGMPGFFLLHSDDTEDNPSDMSAEANSSHVNEMNGEAKVSSSTSKKCSSASDASKDIVSP
ncbi:hypothetical protein NL676_005909 [Syzygium grande]|nr:hypothetical protein NL676_005909 [Syzygium grande]